MDSVDFPSVTKDLLTFKKKLSTDYHAQAHPEWTTAQLLTSVLDEMTDYRPVIVSYMMRWYGIYSYKTGNLKSYLHLASILPIDAVKHVPCLQGETRTYYVLDRNSHHLIEPEHNNIVKVINQMITECHELPRREHHDAKVALKQEERVNQKERLKQKQRVDIGDAQPYGKPETPKPIKAPLFSNYNYRDVIQWHMDMTGDNLRQGYLVIGDYHPESKRPYLVPCADDYCPSDNTFRHLKCAWLSEDQIVHILNYHDIFKKFTMSLRHALHFQTNPYWPIISTVSQKAPNGGTNSIEHQLEYFRFCMMLNGVGDGTPKKV